MPEAPALLSLSPEDMKAFGYAVVDYVVRHFEALPNKPVSRVTSRESLEARLQEPIPSRGDDLPSLLQVLDRDVFGNMMHLDSPRFFAYVSSPSNYISALAAFLTAGLNPIACTWLEAAGPTQIEITTIDWLRTLFGMPQTAGGLFVTGGSLANLHALLVARDRCSPQNPSERRMYCSTQTHSSIDRAAHAIGLSPDQLVKIPVDVEQRIDLEALNARVLEDRSRGLHACCIIGNAGTTSTGAVDDLTALARVAAENGAWFHVDAAYGGAARFSAGRSALLDGIECTDSMAFDPHKWLFQPYETAVLLVRDARLLRETFHILPDYLKDTDRGAYEINYCDYGLQLTRDFKALKLWLSLKFWGAAAFGTAVDRGFELAEHAAECIHKASSLTLLTTPKMGIVCFSATIPNVSPEETSEINRRITEEAIKEQLLMLSTTVLGGTTVLRLCTINPRTTLGDIDATVDRLNALAERMRG